jgi:4-amino-4-deoxy-L-arabinose transferase-like glycosyltransferase
LDTEAESHIARWEWALAALAAGCGLFLGFSRLGYASLWHDELIHVYVAEHILVDGLPLMPSGRAYTGGLLHSYLLAGVIALFGDSETAVRAPSVLFFGVNVLLTYGVIRALLGRGTALVAAFSLALFPWSVAWAREARFYTLNQTAYLPAMFALWRACEAARRAPSVRWGLGACAGYAAGLLTAPHGILFLGAPGAYAAAQTIYHRTVRSRWAAVVAVVALLGTATLFGNYVVLPSQERDMIFKEGQLLELPARPAVDHDQSDALYYFRFFTNNLSVGFFVLACAGFAAMAAREGRRGVFVALAFVVPLLVLNFGIGYRRYRFLFYAYPFFVAAHSYALVWLAAFLPRARRSVLHTGAAALILVFGARTALSTARLVEDSVSVARGKTDTLAGSHPDWRTACAYVRTHGDGAAVLTTSYLPVLYYAGRVDDWYPSRVVVWEFAESGLDGLKTLDDLKAFVARHPRGYFLAEYRRFEHSPYFAEDSAWVNSNMRRIDEASSRDVTVYAWGKGSHF